MSANGLKICDANENYTHKSFIETEFPQNKDAKNTWLACQGFSYGEDPSAIKAAEISRKNNSVRESAENNFYGNVAVHFFTCDKHLLFVVSLYIAFKRSIDDFVIVSDDAAKHYKVKIIEANLHVRNEIE